MQTLRNSDPSATHPDPTSARFRALAAEYQRQNADLARVYQNLSELGRADLQVNETELRAIAEAASVTVAVGSPSVGAWCGPRC